MANEMKRKFLIGLPFFAAWDPVQLVDFNNSSMELRVSKGTVIYDIGRDSSTFYVVR